MVADLGKLIRKGYDMNFKQILILVLFCLLITPHSNAEELPAAQCKTLRTVRVDTPPVIDGFLNDEAWTEAPVITDLHQVDPVEYGPPSQDSEFFVVYDKDALYIGAHLYDDPDKIIGNILRQGDRIFDDDFIDIIIAPFDNDRSGYSFMLNVNNIRGDLKDCLINSIIPSVDVCVHCRVDGFFTGSPAIRMTDDVNIISIFSKRRYELFGIGGNAAGPWRPA